MDRWKRSFFCAYMAVPRIYTIWLNMKARCLNPKNPAYARYGGRGLGFDPRWTGFKNFANDMADSYKDGLTLERIDNNKGYSKENCRWATHKEQNNNKRNNNFVFFHGLTKTLPQWAEFLGIKSSTIRQRYYVYGWTIERCFTKGGNKLWQL